MFILKKHITYFEDAQRRLERRAVCCDEPADLMKKIEEFVLHGKYNADVNDTSFLRAYGDDSDGISPVERTVSAVMNIVTPVSVRSS